MAARDEWCSNQVSKLLNEDSRIPTLNDIKDHFAAIPQEEATRTAKNLQLSLVFDCLNDTNTEQVELACDVLTVCMSNLNLGESTSRYCTPLERALNHPYSTVKIMALKEIQRNMSDDDLLIDISKRSTLLHAVIKCLGDEELSVAKKASDIIFTMASSAGIRQILSADSLKVFHDVMSINEIIRLRVNEVFINISAHDESSMRALDSAGLLSQILEDLDNNDVLLKMNVIELLSRLVVTKHGYTYLQSHGVITKIFKHFEEDGDPLTAQLCEPGILKFFGRMAHWKPVEIISKYPVVTEKLFSNIESDDLIIVGISLDTLGHIAETNEGKHSLESTGNKVLTAIKAITNRIPSFTTEIRIRALNCVENLLRITEFNSQVTNLVRKWYLAMGDDPMDWIFKLAQNPFKETRVAACGVLSAMALHHWGQECFRNTPGFIEFLLDRRSETSKDCKEAKYEIVKTLSTSSVFDHGTQIRLQEFVKEGPFYVEAVTEVAIEGED